MRIVAEYFFSYQTLMLRKKKFILRVEQREEVGRRGVQLQEEAQTTPKTLYVLQTTQYMYMYVYRVVHRVENNLLLTSNLLEKNVHTNLYPNSWQASTS